VSGWLFRIGARMISKIDQNVCGETCYCSRRDKTEINKCPIVAKQAKIQTDKRKSSCCTMDRPQGPISQIWSIIFSRSLPPIRKISAVLAAKASIPKCHIFCSPSPPASFALTKYPPFPFSTLLNDRHFPDMQYSDDEIHIDINSWDLRRFFTSKICCMRCAHRALRSNQPTVFR